MESCQVSGHDLLLGIGQSINVDSPGVARTLGNGIAVTCIRRHNEWSGQRTRQIAWTILPKGHLGLLDRLAEGLPTSL